MSHALPLLLWDLLWCSIESKGSVTVAGIVVRGADRFFIFIPRPEGDGKRMNLCCVAGASSEKDDERGDGEEGRMATDNRRRWRREELPITVEEEKVCRRRRNKNLN